MGTDQYHWKVLHPSSVITVSDRVKNFLSGRPPFFAEEAWTKSWAETSSTDIQVYPYRVWYIPKGGQNVWNGL